MRAVGDVCLCVAHEVIFHNQDVFHDGLLFDAHGNFHRDVVDVYQIQGFRTENGLQWGYLWFGFEDLALQAASDAHHHSLGHAGPPEPLSKQAECAVPTLVPKVSVAPIYCCLSLQPRHHKCQNVFITSFGHHLQVEEVTLEDKILLACGVDAALRVWHLVL